MNNRQENKSSLSGWIFPILMLFFFPPLGIFLLVMKLLSGTRSSASGQGSYHSQRERDEHLGVRTTAGTARSTIAAKARQEAQFARIQQDKLRTLDQRGKRLAIVGGVLTAGMLLGILPGLGEAIYWAVRGEAAWFADELIGILPMLCLACGGLGVFWTGMKRKKQAKRFSRYLTMIGKAGAVPLSALTSASGRPAAKVKDDLEEMLDQGFFPQGYLDHGSDRLIVTGSISAAKPKAAPKAAPAKEEENAILTEIRLVNESIANEKLSAQIDRIGVITAKILEHQKSRPDKAPQLHSFLSYYLPTTLKILRAYATLEAQQVSGENITAAMERIEGMMDKVVEGFEKQLDLLFQGDAMDITTDVEVLERMLAKDGLASGGMTLEL